MNFLRDLALAHQKHEGWGPGTQSYRDNNPGNIRKGGAFLHFLTYEAGLEALENDLYAKICGQSKVMQEYYDAHHITYALATFQDYVNVYAPVGDGNDPASYCKALCDMLHEYALQPTTLLVHLSQLAHNQIQSAPATPQVVVTDPNAKIRGLQRQLSQTTDPAERLTISSVLKRLLGRLGL